MFNTLTEQLHTNPDWAKLSLFNRKDWSTVRFGDVVENINETERNLAESELKRFIGLEHIEPGSLHIRSWGNIGDGTTFTRRCRPGQVLFGKRRAYQRKIAIADFDAVVSGDIYVFAPKNGRLLPELLPFLCLSERFFQYAVGTSAGSLSPRTNWSSLASFEFDLPPLDQQRRITEVLWALDEALCNSDSMLNSLSTALDALVSSLTDSESSNKWISRRLVDCLDIVSGQVDPRIEPYRSMILVAPNHIEQGNGQLIGTETAVEQNSISGKYLFETGDVVYSKIRPNLKKCIIAPFQGLCSADMYALRPKSGMITARFLLAILLSEHFTSFALSRCVRTGIPKINRTELAEYTLPIPGIKVQDEICMKFACLDAALDAGRKHKYEVNMMLSVFLTTVFGDPS